VLNAEVNFEFSLYFSIQHSAFSIAASRPLSRERDKIVRIRTAGAGPIAHSKCSGGGFGPKHAVAHALEGCGRNMTAICVTQPRILIADDQPDLIDALRLLLKGEGIYVDSVSSPEAALAAIAAGSFDLLLMDLNYTGDTTSGREGIDLLARV
jgi:hypothetical protein